MSKRVTRKQLKEKFFFVRNYQPGCKGIHYVRMRSVYGWRPIDSGIIKLRRGCKWSAQPFQSGPQSIFTKNMENNSMHFEC